MDELGDRPLERDPAIATEVTAEARRSSPITLVIIGAAGLAVGGAAAWWWLRDDRAAVSAPSAGGPPGTAVTLPNEPVQSLPPLGQMDTFLRALLGSLSSHPDLVRWLATDDLIRQLAHGIDRIARGQTPARDFTVLRPSGSFQVIRRSRDTTIDPASYRRYDSLAALVQSLDPQAVAEAYRTIQPRLDEAYRGLGRSEGHVDEAVLAALQLLIDTPTAGDTVRVVPGRGATFEFAEPAYERLTPAQKQLLRMGPGNMARVQARLREIRSAIRSSRQ